VIAGFLEELSQECGAAMANRLHMRQLPRPVDAAVALALLLAVGPAVSALAAPSASSGLAIQVLSNRADLISGGDALVELELPQRHAQPRVALDGRDVSKAFALRPNGRYQGLVTGMRNGSNTLVAHTDGQIAGVVITNHPNGGPVFSGPQIQPWTCQTTAVDKQCDQPAAYAFQYVSSTDGSLKAYDPHSPPSDVANTTTDQGVTVPFVLRIETGYQDRDQYQIAVLFDPKKPWSPWAPQRPWNHKLAIEHGSGCGNHYMTEAAPSVTGFGGDVALGRGFAVLSTTLDNAGGNCNVVTQAESLMMAKERLVERYGPIRYTIGIGCSGGSLTQQQVANAYPGIYQGIIPQCSFPDAWTTATQINDAHLLRGYEENPTKWQPGVAWTPADIAAVEGHPNHANAVEFDELFWTSLFSPSSNQYTTHGVPGGCYSVNGPSYDAAGKPDGTRCTFADWMINVFGPRPKNLWTPNERKIGRGFAGLPIDNVGVQYGLDALKEGRISPAQFVDLNAKIGGIDIDANPTAKRLAADPTALRNSYRSGAVNSANNLDQVAVIALSGADYGSFHDAFRTWALRARLLREQGQLGNHVIWYDGRTQYDHNFVTDAFLAMDRWLTAVERDRSAAPLAAKIVRDRPKDVQDRCTTDGYDDNSLPDASQICASPAFRTLYSSPRSVAGEDIANDTQKCALKPLRRQDYYPILFDDAQWATLRATFPTGVCDWSKPGPGQVGATPWLTYQDRAGKVVYGGQPITPAPTGSGFGWTSAAFDSWTDGSRLG
jgi:hypothetical protein